MQRAALVVSGPRKKCYSAAGVDRLVFTESYRPYTQNPVSMTLVLRTALEPTPRTANGTKSLIVRGSG